MTILNGLFVCDNFFSQEDFETVEKDLRREKYYNLEAYEETFKPVNYPGYFPGYRTENLLINNKKIVNILFNTLEQKIPFLCTENISYTGRVFGQLRGENDPDWIHKDARDYTLIVYMSEDNLESGTKFYQTDNNGDEWDMWIRLKKNRLVIFPAQIFHASAKNYTDINGDRLTLNAFLTENIQ